MRRKIRNDEAARDGAMNTTLIEHSEHGDYPLDIFTKLSSERILFLNDSIDHEVAVEFVATLLLKDMEDSEEKISIFINSERGDIRSVLTIYDAMQMISSPLETIGSGVVMNEVVLLLSAGDKGSRFATANTIISPSQLVHEQSYMTDLTDARSVMDRSVKDNKNFMKAFAKTTGKKLSKVMKDFERKKFFTAEQAQKYGIIDAIIKKS